MPSAQLTVVRNTLTLSHPYFTYFYLFIFKKDKKNVED